MNNDDTNRDIDADVLIVGAGPTGLALATRLAQAGVQAMVVDKLAHGRNTSRAAVIHAHTLEVLDQLGVAEQLAERGLKLTRFSIRDRDRMLLRLRFDRLPSPMAYLLMLPQDQTEAILHGALAAAGGAVHRSTTVESVVATPDAVLVTATSPEGTRRIRARWVVGADGMHSVVRQAAAIGFAGATYEESFVLADVEMDWGLGRDEVMLFFSPAGLLVVAPLPNGSFRIVATVDHTPPPELDLAFVQALVSARGPTRHAAKLSRLFWTSRFQLHHRVADHYRNGRMLLVGDAAHVHSPAGGQGMNTGLVDACVLGQLLADVLAGRRAEADLDRYERLRRPAAKRVLGLAGRLTRMAIMRSAPKRFLRNVALRLLNRLPAARHRLEANFSGVSRRAAAVVD